MDVKIFGSFQKQGTRDPNYAMVLGNPRKMPYSLGTPVWACHAEGRNCMSDAACPSF